MKSILILLRKSRIHMIGGLALLWFIVRVIPKPSRAAYPCQRAAFPLASAFVIWTVGTLFSFRFFRNAGTVLRRSRVAGAAGLLVAGVTLLGLSNLVFPVKRILAGVTGNRSEIPEMIRGYALESGSSKFPEATVGMVKAETREVFEIGYEEVEQMVRTAVGMAGGLEGIITDGNTVVLKPNIVVYDFKGNPISAEANGMVTDWRVVSAVAKMVRELNPSGEILVMEGSSGESTMEGFRILKYTKEFIPEVDEFIAIEEASGAWHDNASDQIRSTLLSSEKALCSQFKLGNGAAAYYYNKRYFEADVIISLPVLKNHEAAGVTGAVKNMGIGGTPTNIYGNGPDENGRWNVVNHSSSNLQKFIHDFYLGCPAHFAVMDGIQGYSNGPNWNNGPQYIEGHHEGMGLILASRDPLALDAIASLVMYHDPKLVPYLVYLNNDGLGCADPMAIKVVGSLVSDVKKPFAHENHATVCDYTDGTPPSAYIAQMGVRNQHLEIALADTAGLTRVDVQVDGQFLDRFIMGNFGNIEVDLSLFKLSDSLVTLFIHDRYMNTGVLTAKLDGTLFTGMKDHFSTGLPTVYPNPAVSSLSVRLTLENPGQLLLLLYNLSGEVVAEQRNEVAAGRSELDFNIRDTPAGSYILLVVAGSERHSIPVIKL
jgi:uncharacterized protein (DUF362 family)